MSFAFVFTEELYGLTGLIGSVASRIAGAVVAMGEPDYARGFLAWETEGWHCILGLL